MTARTRSNNAYAWGGAYNVSRTYGVNGLNQYTAAGGASFAYDGNGNLTSDGGNTYTYDVENRLVSVSGGHNAALRYDPLGRLYEVTSAAGTTHFLYDGDALVAEYDGSGNLLRRHVHRPGADVPVMTYEGAGLSTPRFLHTDHQGSIVAMSDASGNATIDTYDEWGIPGASNAGRFQYTGQAWMAELGMYYYKARIYSPTLGRFLQTDPVGYEDQVNLYAYVANDPVNATDPDGECEIRTGSRICEQTRDVYFSVQSGDQNRIYRSTVSSRDGFVFRTQFFASEGIGDSFSPLELLPAGRIVGAIGKIGEALGLRSIFGLTEHGALRTGLAGVGRGGTLTYVESITTRLTATRILTQGDGARVFVKEVVGGRFNVVVAGARGTITTFRGLGQRSLDRLASRYGWR